MIAARGSIATQTLLAFAASTLLVVGCGSETAPETPTGVLVLLLADGPLAVEPMAPVPDVGRAGGEAILNNELVPPVTIQGGLSLYPLNADSIGRSFSVVDWPPDIVLRRHWHPVTERVWMVDGSMESPDGVVEAGEFWEAPAQVSMGPFTSDGSFFVFLGEGPFETFYLAEGEDAPVQGSTTTVDPGELSWQPLSDVFQGSEAEGNVKVLSPPSTTDRGAYLVRLSQSGNVVPVALGADVEGYVLEGTLEYSDPYHGRHILSPGFYFRIPSGFPSSIIGS